MLTEQEISAMAESWVNSLGRIDSPEECPTIFEAYIAAYQAAQEEMLNQWVSVETPPDHGTRVLLRHDYGNGIEYSTDLWCDEIIKFLTLNYISHYQIISPFLPVINKG